MATSADGGEKAPAAALLHARWTPFDPKTTAVPLYHREIRVRTPVELSGKYPGWNGTLTRARLETGDTGDYVSSLRGPGCWATTGPVCPRWGPPKGRSG